jgi:hypothetical protein
MAVLSVLAYTLLIAPPETDDHAPPPGRSESVVRRMKAMDQAAARRYAFLRTQYPEVREPILFPELLEARFARAGAPRSALEVPLEQANRRSTAP